MSDLISKYDIPKKEMARGKKLAMGAVAAPLGLTAVPAALFGILLVLFGSAPPAAVTIVFFGVVSVLVGLLIGLILSGVFLYKRSNWTREMRERIAADGIRPSELEWFMHELKSSERRTLKQVEKMDPLLGDAYREALANRLTAARISKNTKRDLALMERRRSKLKMLKAERTSEFLSEIDSDVVRLNEINTEARQLLIESEARLQMLEAGALRGGGLNDNEIALKKLGTRRDALPLALEEAKIAEEIRRELESEDRKLLHDE